MVCGEAWGDLFGRGGAWPERRAARRTVALSSANDVDYHQLLCQLSGAGNGNGVGAS